VKYELDYDPVPRFRPVGYCEARVYAAEVRRRKPEMQVKRIAPYLDPRDLPFTRAIDQ